MCDPNPHALVPAYNGRQRSWTAGVFIVIALASACDRAPAPYATAPRPPSASKDNVPQENTALAEGDSDWVRTPAGILHRTCVHEIPRGAVLGRERVVRRHDGSSYTLPACKYAARWTVPGRLSSRPPSGDVGPNTPPVGAPDGWIEYTLSVNNPTTYRQLSAAWHVPNTPVNSVYTGKIYYTFPGLQSSIETGAYILQPVVQYGFNNQFGGNYFAAANWYCDSNGAANCYHGTPMVVSAGDLINGSIVASNCSGSQCTWTVTTQDATSGQQIADNFDSDLNFPYAVGGAVEAYGLTRCNDFPGQTPNYLTSGVFYTGITLRDAQGNIVTPTWGTSVSSAFPACRLGVEYDATSTGLHSSQPFEAGIYGPTSINRYQSAQYTAFPRYGTGQYTYQWRTRTSSNFPPSPYGWTSWGPWYDTPGPDTYLSISSCNVRQVDLQLMVTDHGNNGGSSTAVIDNYIAINNPC